MATLLRTPSKEAADYKQSDSQSHPHRTGAYYDEQGTNRSHYLYPVILHQCCLLLSQLWRANRSHYLSPVILLLESDIVESDIGIGDIAVREISENGRIENDQVSRSPDSCRVCKR